MQLGFRRGVVFATAASVGEVVAGLLVALGFLGPVGPALMIAIMLVAAIRVHWEHGLVAMTNGIEVPFLYATGAFGLALTGMGPYSLDALLGLTSTWTPALTWGALSVGVIGGLANLVARRRPAAVRGA